MNIFADIPKQLGEEFSEEILSSPNLRIERIVSEGQSSPEDFWYEQEENEWVIVLQGEAELEYEDGKKEFLKAGDYCNIPRGCKHRVSWTSNDEQTIWLALFY